MAEVKTPVAPKAHTPAAPVAPPATPPAAPAAKPKVEIRTTLGYPWYKTKDQVQHPVAFATAEEAIAEAGKRVDGPRQAFKVSHGGKEAFVVVHNEYHAGAFFLQYTLRGSIERIDKPGGGGGKSKAISIDAVMAAVNALPAEQRDKVLAQLNIAKA